LLHLQRQPGESICCRGLGIWAVVTVERIDSYRKRIDLKVMTNRGTYYPTLGVGADVDQAVLIDGWLTLVPTKIRTQSYCSIGLDAPRDVTILRHELALKQDWRIAHEHAA
jgi:sRNA-binding carbon storage regulator CsrA